jgi:methionyl aminopeptidase
MIFKANKAHKAPKANPPRRRAVYQPPVLIKPQDYDNLRRAGQINGQILAALRAAVRPGMQTIELDHLARQLLQEAGAEAPFLNYSVHPNGQHPYPAVINVSVNEELVHGIPGKRILKEGDVVTLDCGTKYNGMIVDSAITVGVGAISEKHQRLIHATHEALMVGIQMASPGRRVGDISFAIETILRKYQVNIPPNFGGHGVGYSLHAAPHVANEGKPNQGELLQVGMALAIEPMGMYGRNATRTLADHWTIVTTDRSVCAHSEHTILITETGTEILTPVPNA